MQEKGLKVADVCVSSVEWYVDAYVIIPSEVLTTPSLSSSHSAITLVCAVSPYQAYASLLRPSIFFVDAWRVVIRSRSID